MRAWLLILALLTLAAAPAAAQDIDDADGGRGFLTSRIEGLLSGAGREVRITGFEGALSSRATIDRLTIADDEGVWLTIEDAVFDWDRSALFGRRLEIQELSAGLIKLDRFPASDPGVQPPRATAREFKLPELPVSVEIGRVAAERVELGAPILGQPAALSLEGSGRLSDGTAEVRLDARRVDDAEGRFVVDASYDPGAGGLDLTVTLDEGAGGIAATALGIPGEPPLTLAAEATGTPSDLSAEFALGADGADRLAGTFALRDEGDGRRFALDARGDVAPLLAPDYRDFFGDDLSVTAEGSQTEGEGFELSALSVETAELSLRGSASIAPGGLPDAFDLALVLRNGEDGVRLPVGGEVRVGAADLTARFDASEGEAWTLSGTIETLRTGAVDVGRLTLDGGGTISRADPRAVTGEARLTASGVEADDPGLVEALGSEITLGVDAGWAEGQPVDLRSLRVSGAGFEVSAEGQVAGATLDGTVTANLEDLSQFDALTGASLGGALEVRAEGSFAPLSGAFDARLTGTGRDLSTGIEAADALIGGQAQLVVDAARTVEGTEIREFTIETEALRAEVEGHIAPDAEEAVRLSYTAQLHDVGRLVEQVSGPATIEGTVMRAGALGQPPEAQAEGVDARWRVTLQAEAPQETSVTLFATVPDEGAASVDFEASVGDLEPYVAQLPGPASVQGRARREGGDWTANLTADLPQDITARADATLSEAGALAADFDASVGELGAFVPQLAGEATLTGSVTRDAETQDVRAVVSADLPQGIEAEVTAALPAEGPATAAFDARIADLGAFVPQLPGEATLSGSATRDADGVEASFDLAAPQGIEAQVEATLPAEGPTTAAFDARVADLGAFTDLVEGPATLTGTATRSDDGVTAVDARMDGPEGIEATLDARLVGEALSADLDAQVPDVGAFVPALEGPAAIDAAVRREDGATRATLSVDGPQGIEAEIAATLPAEGPIEATYDARVSDVSALAPLPEGPAALSGTATRTADGAVSTDARLTAPAGIAADVTASLAASGDIQAELDATVAEPGALREGLPGPIEAEVAASRTNGAWTANADVTAPGDTRLALDATLPPEGDAAVDFDLALADPAPYLNGLPGPLTATGTARRDPEGWTAEVDAAAADGSRITADATLPDEGRAEVAFDARLADLGRFVPRLPSGEATAQGTATREDGTWSAQAQLTAPAGIAARVEGSLAPSGDADVTFDAAVGELGRFVPQLPGEATAQGTVRREGGAFVLDVEATGPRGTSASLDGTYDPQGPTDVDFDLRLGDVAPFVPQLSGPVAAQGTLTSQGAQSPLAIDAAVEGPAGSRAQLGGTLARDFATADLSASGTAPLDLANPFIRPRAIDGTARFDLRLDGPLEPGSLTGTVSAQGARLALPDQRLAIEGIDAEVRLAAGRAVLDVTGELSTGGRLAASGPIALAPPFEADLSVTAEDLVIVDPLLYETTVDAGLSVTGPLTGSGGRIAGTIQLAETEVRIPSSGFGGSGAIPLIEHVGAPRAVQLTRQRARLADVAPASRRGTPQNNVFDLDIRILAENRIFVRGRGLDAELGGALRLTGSTADVVPVGEFDLIRGRLDLLGQRFDFDEGSFSLQGDFVPVIRLVAVTETDDDQISIILEGELTDPDLRIVSGAGLPQDEAIARLLFGRDLRELSPLQAARLANAVAELSGRGGALGLVSGLREGLGLDDLDITSNEEGVLALRAGRYLTDNVYTDLSIDEQGQTEINLNLDVTDDVTVKGRVNAEGRSGLGLFFERDY